MPYYSDNSNRALDTCHPDLQRVFREVIKHRDCSILEGHRGEGRQNMLFDQGKSWVRWPKGKHNKKPSQAVDVMPYPIDWKDDERNINFAQFVLGVAAGMGIILRWGGDWDMDSRTSDETKRDFPHFELVRV